MYGLVSKSSLYTYCFLIRHFEQLWILTKICEYQIFKEYGNKRQSIGTVYSHSVSPFWQNSTALAHFSWLSILWSVMHAQLSCSKTVWCSTILTGTHPKSQVPRLWIVSAQTLPTEFMASLLLAANMSPKWQRKPGQRSGTKVKRFFKAMFITDEMWILNCFFSNWFNSFWKEHWLWPHNFWDMLSLFISYLSNIYQIFQVWSTYLDHLRLKHYLPWACV